MNASMTLTRPALTPAISLVGLAIPVLVALLAAPETVLLPPALPLAADPVAVVPLVVAAVPAVMELLAWASNLAPRVGRATLPFTCQTSLVKAGQDGAVAVGVYADMLMPDGVKVAH